MAIRDVGILASALSEHFEERSEAGIDAYSPA
jgi:hypothetical protein